MRTLQVAVLGLAAFLVGCGGGGAGPSIGGDPDTVVVSGKGVKVVVTDAKTIELLVDAVEDAVPDDGTYTAPLDCSMEFVEGGESLATIKFSGGLLAAEDKQYVDESAQIVRIAGAMLECKSALLGELDYEWEKPVSGSTKLSYKVTNVGAAPVKLSTTFRMYLYFTIVLDEEDDQLGNVPARMPARQKGYVDVTGKLPIELAPGASHVFTFTVPLEDIRPGKKSMSIRFIRPRTKEHVPIVVPEDEMFAPPVMGMLITVQ